MYLIGLDRNDYLRALVHIDGYELQRDKQWLFKIDVNWRMPVWPQRAPSTDSQKPSVLRIES